MVNIYGGKFHRRSIRLKGHDYSKAGAYFVTICTQDKICLFAEFSGENILLNDSGKMILGCVEAVVGRFENVNLDVFVVMPNHIHMIIILNRMGGRPPLFQRKHFSNQCFNGHAKYGGNHKGQPCPMENSPHGTMPGSLGRIVQAFKSITTNEYIRGVQENQWVRFPGRLWQRNYYEHIIRNERELNRLREYIRTNPLKWELDTLNPNMGNWSPG